IYKGMRIGIYSGTGVGQIKRITLYDPSTRIATVDSNWDITPDGTSIYAIISPIPAQMHELLCLGAAIRAAGMVDDSFNEYVEIYQSLKKDFFAEIHPRIKQTSRRVRTTWARF